MAVGARYWKTNFIGGNKDKFNPFTFAGRIGRLQYFGFAVIWAVIVLVVASLSTTGAANSGQIGAGGASAISILTIVYFIATLSYGVRRLHDFDKSGWWYLLTFIPFANIVMGLVLLLAPGSVGPNGYGAR